VTGDPVVVAHYNRIADEDIFLSIIAVREVVRGITDRIGEEEKKGAKYLPKAYEYLTTLLKQLEDFQIHPYTPEADALYQSWSGKGSGPGQNDWRIAASAVSASFTVVTADKGFGKIQSFVPQLRVEDWGLVDS
jgi:predicted nucleic acid-binding protein